MLKKFCLLLLASLFLLVSQTITASEIKIGVLAKRGAETALKKWQPTADYLSHAIKGYTFKIIPLGFGEIHLAVRQKKIDFVIANSAFYVELEHLYQISRIATLKNKHTSGQSYTVFSGTIFTRSDNESIKKLNDIKNISLAAVDEQSFGGWMMAWLEFKNAGIDPYKDLTEVKFLRTHDAVVYAVLDGKVDVGTVRSDTLERMALEGEINLTDFYIINEQSQTNFPFLHSTALYPEWPVARLKNTPAELAQNVAITLMKMPIEHNAALASKSEGWTIPSNYQKVHDLTKTLAIGAYKETKEITLLEMLIKHWHFFTFILLAFLLAISILGYILLLNRNYHKVQIELSTLNNDLEQKVKERTDNIESYLKRERYLRSILSTVTDINQYLLTQSTQGELLTISCQRFIQERYYSFAHIYLNTGMENRRHYQSSQSSFFKSFTAFFDEKKNIDKFPPFEALEKNKKIVINNIMTFSVDETFRNLLHKAGIHAVIALPLYKDANTMPLGVLSVFSSRSKGFELEEINMLEELSGDIGFAINSFRQQSSLENLQQERIKNYQETILSFVKMIEDRDTYTAGHSSRVSRYSVLIAKEMGYKNKDIEHLKDAAILHDIGKISTPDAILLKPDHLNDLEYSLIKQHVSVGYDMLKNINIYYNLLEIMRHHHEHYDGNGYPQGLKGNEIPELSCIMSVADAFDAMTSVRIYKKNKSKDEAIAELLKLKGKQFNPIVVDAAVKVLPDVVLDNAITQFPQSEIEKQRLAYFYKDRDSNLFNEDYLNVLLNQKDLKNSYPFIYKITPHGETKEERVRSLLNNTYELNQWFSNDLLFRYHDEYLLIFSNTEIHIEHCKIIGEGWRQKEILITELIQDIKS